MDTKVVKAAVDKLVEAFADNPDIAEVKLSWEKVLVAEVNNMWGNTEEYEAVPIITISRKKKKKEKK